MAPSASATSMMPVRPSVAALSAHRSTVSETHFEEVLSLVAVLPSGPPNSLTCPWTSASPSRLSSMPPGPTLDHIVRWVLPIDFGLSYDRSWHILYLCIECGMCTHVQMTTAFGFRCSFRKLLRLHMRSLLMMIRLRIIVPEIARMSIHTLEVENSWNKN
jgi:hypothetical protein